MNLQSVVIVLMRLAAVDMALRATLIVFAQFTERIVFAFSPHHANQYSPFIREPDLVATFLEILVYIVIVVALWLCAKPVGRLIVRDVPSDVPLPALSLADGYSIAFAAIGVCEIASGIPLVIAWVNSLILENTSITNGFAGGTVAGRSPGLLGAQAIITVIAGIALLVNARIWGQGLARKDAATPAVL